MLLNNVVWRKWRGGGGRGGLEKVLFAEKGFSSLIGGLKYFRESNYDLMYSRQFKRKHIQKTTTECVL